MVKTNSRNTSANSTRKRRRLRSLGSWHEDSSAATTREVTCCSLTKVIANSVTNRDAGGNWRGCGGVGGAKEKSLNGLIFRGGVLVAKMSEKVARDLLWRTITFVDLVDAAVDG